jgi:hypothetical protein
MTVLEKVSDIGKFATEVSSAVKQEIGVNIKYMRRAKRTMEQLYKAASVIPYPIYTVISYMIRLAMADAVQIYKSDMGSTLWRMFEDVYIIGLLVFYVLSLSYKKGTFLLIMMESIWNCMRIAILCSPIQLLSLYSEEKYIG